MNFLNILNQNNGVSMKNPVLSNNVFKTIIYIIILFPFIQQRTYSELPKWISKFYIIYSIISSTIIYIFIFLKRKYNPFINKQWLFYLFWFLYLISTLINCYLNIDYVFYYAYISIAVVSFIFYSSKKDINTLIQALSIIYGIFIFLNGLLFIFNPTGIYQTQSYHNGHLLGDDNAIIYVALPGLIIIICNSILKRKKISLISWFLLIITEYTFYKLWAVSSLVCLSIFIILLIYTLRKNSPNPKTLFIVIFCVIFFMIFGFSNTFLQKIIITVLKKDITLSGRTYIWKQAINLISNRLILGYGGYFTYGKFKPSINSWLLYPSHTPFLQLAIDGGIFLLLTFIIITFIAYIEASKHKKNLYSRVLSIGLTCMLLNYVTEYSQTIHYMIIVSLMFCIKNNNIEGGNNYEISK